MPSTTQALFIFLAWSGVQAVLLLASLRSRQPLPELLAAVEKVEPSMAPAEKGDMARGFLWISVVWFVLATTIAAVSFSSASKGSLWALAVFTAIGGWSLYDAASSPVVLGRMYPGSIKWTNWLTAVLSSTVWLLLFVMLAIQWLS
ncbi:hypothetical protein [Polaromonas sp. P5_D5]